MLVALFDGRGLTTTRGKVPPMPELPVVLPPVLTPSVPVRVPVRALLACLLVKYPSYKPQKLL